MENKIYCQCAECKEFLEISQTDYEIELTQCSYCKK